MTWRIFRSSQEIDEERDVDTVDQFLGLTAARE
jgi:hypothetical protein